MYTQFYGLREKPFTLSPDPKYLYLSDSHREALAHLLYGIEQGEGFISITGEVGTGKTTLCRTLIQRLDPATEVAFVFNPPLSGLELLQAIHHELGLLGGEATRQELTEELNTFLLEKKGQGRRVLLIIDEAQNLEREALEQVRLLSNLETNTAKLIQIILLGQPELDTKLESPDLRQLRQRITVRWRLAPLSASETREYVAHRLRIAAGGSRELFTELALREIHRRSRGIPRLINLLCDRALLSGYAAQVQSIGLGLLSEVEREVNGAPRSSRPRARRWFERFSLRPEILLAALFGATAVALLLGLALSTGFAGRMAGELRPPPVTARPAPLRAEKTTEAAATPASDVSAAPPASSGAPVDLALSLARLSPAAATAASFDALLQAWGEPPSGRELLSIGQAQDELRTRGFSVLALTGADLAMLRSLGHPALLLLSALDGAPRPVLLAKLEGEEAILRGVGGPDGVRVARSDLAAHWGGGAFVAWRNPARLPELLRAGARGEPVSWVQRTLIALGYLTGPAEGSFDDLTERAVRAFQTKAGLTPDGTVGPVTQLFLYQRAPGGEPGPRLTEPTA
jgi:general secretion pathway protein A